MNPEHGGRDFSAWVGVPSSERRVGREAHGVYRVSLLRLMQKVFLGLFAFGLAVNYASGYPQPARTHWTFLLVGLALATALAWRLGAWGHYRLAATGTVLVALCIPWSSLLLDASVSPGDYQTMAYALIPLLLAAMLLGVKAVLVVAAFQGVGFAVLISLAPDSGFNWPRLLTLIFVVTVISFTYAVVSEADVRQLEVANDRLNELQAVLQHEARHDPLTGLHNRRHLEEQSVGEISRAQRSGTGLGLVMLDIDQLKEVNDEHGHSSGDEVLVAVASLLSTHSRAGDIACRLGGDEFLLVLVDSNLTGTALRAERLREDVQKANAVGVGQSISVSVGVSAYPDHGDRFEVLLDAADRALYAAKADGRNRVVVATVAP